MRNLLSTATSSYPLCSSFFGFLRFQDGQLFTQRGNVLNRRLWSARMTSCCLRIPLCDRWHPSVACIPSYICRTPLEPAKLLAFPSVSRIIRWILRVSENLWSFHVSRFPSRYVWWQLHVDLLLLWFSVKIFFYYFTFCIMVHKTCRMFW